MTTDVSPTVKKILLLLRISLHIYVCVMVQFSNQFTFLKLVLLFQTLLYFLEFSYYMNIFSKLISGINIFQKVVIIILVSCKVALSF